MVPAAVVNGVAVMYGVTLLSLGAAHKCLVFFVGVVLKSLLCHDMLHLLRKCCREFLPDNGEVCPCIKSVYRATSVVFDGSYVLVHHGVV